MNISILTKWLTSKGWENVTFDGAWVSGDKDGKPVYMSKNDARDEWKAGK